MASEPLAARPAGGVAFDWWMAVLSCLFLAGLYVDGWAHNHLNRIETFFTPWHAMFYGGFLLIVAFVVWTMLRSHSRGYAWSVALPAGYEWSLFGIAIFALSGLADMLWHVAFGIEKSISALLSPTHLGLATGMMLIFAGPFRATVRRRTDGVAGSRLLPAVASLALVLSLLTFMTQFAPALFQWGTGPTPPANLIQTREGWGVTSQLWSTALMIGVILIAVRTWGAQLPVGSMTLLFAANAAFMATQLDLYDMLPGVVATGIASDALLAALRPSSQRVRELRLFAVLVPVTYWAFHYATLFATKQPLYYPLPLWTGCIAISGMIGLLASFLAVPQRAGEQPARG